jgi:DNA mismatch repair protein MutL
MGFDIEVKKDTLFLTALPDLLKDRNLTELIHELVDDLSERHVISDIDSISHTMIAYLACRGAVKAGERLTESEAKRLIEKLDKTPNNATCPHGRPTRIEVSLKELHKWFKRE